MRKKKANTGVRDRNLTLGALWKLIGHEGKISRVGGGLTWRRAARKKRDELW